MPTDGIVLFACSGHDSVAWCRSRQSTTGLPYMQRLWPGRPLAAPSWSRRHELSPLLPDPVKRGTVTLAACLGPKLIRRRSGGPGSPAPGCRPRAGPAAPSRSAAAKARSRRHPAWRQCGAALRIRAPVARVTGVLFRVDPADQILLADRIQQGRMVGGHVPPDHPDHLVIVIAARHVPAFASDQLHPRASYSGCLAQRNARMLA